ncbi:MAG: hypothetical protein EXS16_01825 [Gemmataceae bacterium]|nr:hypothetical protein [Gemmataceae bacterium]
MNMPDAPSQSTAIPVPPYLAQDSRAVHLNDQVQEITDEDLAYVSVPKQSAGTVQVRYVPGLPITPAPYPLDLDEDDR